MKDFLELFNLSDRIISDFEAIDGTWPLIDYSLVTKKLNEYRDASLYRLYTMISR